MTLGIGSTISRVPTEETYGPAAMAIIRSCQMCVIRNCRCPRRPSARGQSGHVAGWCADHVSIAKTSWVLPSDLKWVMTPDGPNLAGEQVGAAGLGVSGADVARKNTNPVLPLARMIDAPSAVGTTSRVPLSGRGKGHRSNLTQRSPRLVMLRRGAALH